MVNENGKDSVLNTKTFYSTLLKNAATIIKISPVLIIIEFVASTFFNVSLPYIFRYIDAKVIDEALKIAKSGTPVFTTTLILLIVGSFLLRIFSSIRNELFDLVERRVNFDITKYFTLKFLEKSVTLDIEAYEDPEKRDTIKKASDTYAWRPRIFFYDALKFIEEIINFIIGISIILTLSPFFILVVLLTNVPAWFFRQRSMTLRRNLWDENAEISRKYYNSQYFITNNSSLMEIRIFKSYKYLLSIIYTFYDILKRREISVNNKTSILYSASEIISEIGIVIFWIYAISRIITGDLSVGLFYFYSGTLNSLATSISSFFSRFSDLREGAVYIKDLDDFFNIKNKIISGQTKLAQNSESPSIEFKRVSFRYPGNEKYALKNFNLKINPQEKIAFVGENGSGKTTIIKLLCRFYDVCEGEILINGLNIKDLDLDDWYKHLGILFQEFQKYEFLTIKESIGISNVEKINDLDLVKSASKKAKADKFIEALPLSYDHVLSKDYKNGTTLSGGQWQRLAIARVFFRDAPILILDEPTSAIDSRAEYEIFKDLFTEYSNKTIIIISHRFSTVRNADKVYVLDEGKICESGSHQELMQLNGQYAKAFSIQAEGYK